MVCVLDGYCYTALTSLTYITSLQVSSNISTPFNPYRHFRIPDHLNRSRFPINISGAKCRTMPGKPPGPELWNPPASTSTNYRPSNPTVVVKQAIPVHQQYHAQCIGPSHIVAHPADIEASYFQSCLTPDHSSMNEEWDNSK